MKGVRLIIYSSKAMKALAASSVSLALILSVLGSGLLLIRTDLRRDESRDGLRRYQVRNFLLRPYVKGRVVFFGDSITDFWASDHPSKFFPGKPYIGRGISGESTDGMVMRFHQDVIDVHPDAVVILGGTNDVLLPERHIGFDQTTQNIAAMVTMAQQARIAVVLCSILPVSRLPPAQEEVYSERIHRINDWIQRYASKKGVPYVDYHSAMADETNSLKDSLSGDGVHPNDAGYDVMRPLAEQGIERALQGSRPKS